jgi:hypothetical protein
MSVPDPFTAVALAERWIFQQLSQDEVILGLVGDRVYAGLAPEGSSYPLVVYQFYTGQDTTAPGFRRVLSQVRYLVRCADRVGSIAALDQIAARCDALLHGQTYQWESGALQLGAQRERVMSTPAQIAGMQTREIVQEYLIVVEEAGSR